MIIIIIIIIQDITSSKEEALWDTLSDFVFVSFS